MKKYFYLVMLPICLALGACSDSDDESNSFSDNVNDRGVDGLKGYWIRDYWQDFSNYGQGNATSLMYFDGNGAGKRWDFVSDRKNAIKSWGRNG